MRYQITKQHVNSPRDIFHLTLDDLQEVAEHLYAMKLTPYIRLVAVVAIPE